MHEEKNGSLKHHCENHERCMQMIQALLDGSATQEEMEHIKKEMDMCLPCLEGYEEYKSLKTMLKGNVERKKCPEDTISNIRTTVGMSILILIGVLIALV